MKSTKYKRNCPTCGDRICYSNKYSLKTAIDKSTNCKSCTQIEISSRPEIKDQRSKNMSGKNNHMYGMTGSKNPFFGKTHTQETKNILKRKRKDRSWVYQTDEFLSKMKRIGQQNRGKHNPMADPIIKQRHLEAVNTPEYKRRQSEMSRGKNNSMYGKPSPNGSGNGWSGWYQNWFFRSLHELSYVINVINRFDLKWQSAESKDLMISYKDFNNTDRTYRADFLIEDKYLVEIKPKRLHNSPKVKLKQRAAISFCESHNLIYKLSSPRILTDEELTTLYTAGDIEFIERYEEKFKNRFL